MLLAAPQEEHPVCKKVAVATSNYSSALGPILGRLKSENVDGMLRSLLGIYHKQLLLL